MTLDTLARSLLILDTLARSLLTLDTLARSLLTLDTPARRVAHREGGVCISHLKTTVSGVLCRV